MYLNICKIDKNVGLPIHMISKLVVFLGGSFKTLTKKETGVVLIEFCLPFNSISCSKFMVKTPKVNYLFCDYFNYSLK